MLGEFMSNIKFFNQDLTENERKTITSLIDIESGTTKLVKKSLSEICTETKIRNPKNKFRKENHIHRGPIRAHKGNNTNRGYQQRILNELITRGIIEKDENKKYCIKNQYLDLAYGSLIKKKINKSEQKGLFQFLNTAVFGIKKEWQQYPEIHPFHEALVEILNSGYIIKTIKKIFLLRDLADKWKEFLDTDLPWEIKYLVWHEVNSNLWMFDEKNDNEFLKKQINILKQMQLPVEKINECKIKIKNQYNDFIVELRKKLNYKPRKPSIKKSKRKLPILQDNIVQMFIDKVLNKKQKEQLFEILDYSSRKIRDDIYNTSCYIDIGSSGFHYGSHFKIPENPDEKVLNEITNKMVRNRLESVYTNINSQNIDQTLQKLYDTIEYNNFQRFFYKYNHLIVKLINDPLIKTIYKEMKEESRRKIIKAFKDDNPKLKGKTDYEIFYRFAITYFYEEYEWTTN